MVFEEQAPEGEIIVDVLQTGGGVEIRGWPVEEEDGSTAAVFSPGGLVVARVKPANNVIRFGLTSVDKLHVIALPSRESNALGIARGVNGMSTTVVLFSQ